MMRSSAAGIIASRQVAIIARAGHPEVLFQPVRRARLRERDNAKRKAKSRPARHRQPPGNRPRNSPGHALRPLSDCDPGNRAAPAAAGQGPTKHRRMRLPVAHGPVAQHSRPAAARRRFLVRPGCCRPRPDRQIVRTDSQRRTKRRQQIVVFALGFSIVCTAKNARASRVLPLICRCFDLMSVVSLEKCRAASGNAASCSREKVCGTGAQAARTTCRPLARSGGDLRWARCTSFKHRRPSFGLQAAGRLMTEVFAPWVQDLALLVESVEAARPPGALPDWQPGADRAAAVFQKDLLPTATWCAARR